MKTQFFNKRVVGGGAFGAIFCSIIILASMATAINLSTTNEELNNLSYTYLFKEPNLKLTLIKDQDFTQLEMDGCMAIGRNSGEPTIPIKPISLLLPPMKDVANINIIGTPVELNLNGVDLIDKPVFPYQNPVPVGSAPSDFVMNENVYATNALYPGVLQDDYQIGYSHGHTILNVNLNPIQYNPVNGKIKYYPKMTVNIELKDISEMNQFYRNNPNDKAWVEKLVDNPDITNMYGGNLATFDYPGGLCDPEDSYDYVIVTTEHGDLDYWETTGQIPYNWESLMEYHTENDGLSCTLVTVQDIDACEDYQNEDPLFNDQEAHIREFCRDAYQDWETSYIFVGADAEWIPARLMTYDYESNVDSDLYWSNLDNTFNEDHDNRWGEEGDTGFDLYSELFIGRITCDGPQDVSNWMKKSLYYADSLETDYLDNAAFYGGDTTWPCQGDDFIDFGAIKGTDNWLGPNPGDHGPYPSWAGFLYGFETWNEEHSDDQYDLSVAWTNEPPNEGWQGGNAEQGLRTAINEDRVTLISGVAHATADMSLDVSSSTWESQYHNTKPFFLTDFGCHCGDMDARDDGVLHSMLFHSDTELAFACIYHTGYGWGSLMDTNSSSALQMKLFWDYMFDLENSGYPTEWQMGKAMAWSKDAMAPTIDWTYPDAPGSWRGTIQSCLLFGDPAQKLKNPHPNLPPEQPTKPDGPEEWAQFGEASFSSTAIDPEGDSIDFLFDWGDGTDSGWLGPYASGQTCKATHSWTIVGEYQVKAKVRDDKFGQSLWSEPATINIVENEPPGAPTMVDGETSGLPRILMHFTFSAEDPEGNDISYMVSWGDGSYEPWTGLKPSGTQVTFSHAWSEVNVYTVNVRAKDQYGAKGPQASFSIMIVKNKAITNPMLFRFIEKLTAHFPVLVQFLQKYI